MSTNYLSKQYIRCYNFIDFIEQFKFIELIELARFELRLLVVGEKCSKS